MALHLARTQHPSAARLMKLVQSLLRDFHPRDFDVELWDGTRWNPERGRFRRFTWKINNPDIAWDVLHSSNRELALGEAYVRGDFDVLGDLEAAFPLADYLIGKEWTTAEKLRFAASGARAALKRRNTPGIRPRISGVTHSKTRDQAAIRYHYDVSNDFYRLWLDRNLVYSCAYFRDPSDDLDTAQIKKMDQICSSLELKSGERLIDIGCGWGGLILHAVRHYGVRAVGITLSEKQAELAQRRVHDQGLSDRCQVRVLDYRSIGQLGSCDKLASIGMIEHVGESRLEEYFHHAFHALRPDGLFLLSGIGRAGNRPFSDAPTFTDVYVFPDGELETIGTMLDRAEKAGFEVRSVENLRDHYARTTSQWLQRLEANAEEATAIVGDTRYRIWRLYLGGSAYYFRKAWLGLYQTLLRKNHGIGEKQSYPG